MNQECKLLVIEDNLNSQGIIGRIFKNYDEYELRFAKEGKRALDILIDYKPDLIIMDIVLPGINGLELAKLIKKKSIIKNLPIIFLTGRTDMESRLKAFEYGGVDYICKPFTPVELIERVKVHIKLKKTQDELRLKNRLLAEREKLLSHLVEERTRELMVQLYTDSLTKLPNRLRLLEDIHAADIPILILINVDSFKEINSFYGHVIGDSVLVELSNRLQNVIKKRKCQLYKLHADEFAILMQEEMGKESLYKFVQKLHDIVELLPYNIKPFVYEDHDIILDISIGVCNDYDKDNILERADMALKYTKRTGKHWRIYDKSMEIMKEYGNNLKWTRILNGAIKSERIINHYQPIYNNEKQEFEKYEALVRLINEAGQVILPEYFLKVAKKSKQYFHITKSVIIKAFEKFKNRNAEITINLSVEDILSRDTVDFITEYLIKYNIGHKVVFEIVESEGINEYQEVFDFIGKMKELGCKIAIDDFGSGYSNFQHILRLNVDYIKIDASLIENLDTDRNSQILVETIVEFCKKLGIKTIAEKVHSKSIFKKVVSLGVCYSQGFFLGKPAPKLMSS